MPSDAAMAEFRSRWLPNMTAAGLSRLADLLEAASPLLIHGAFTRAVPMGCLASHIAWNHPATSHLNEDAGICWLSRVAGLNPATSAVILDWDRDGVHDRKLRAELAALCREELALRCRRSSPAVDLVATCH